MLCWHKVFRITIAVPVHQRHSRIKLRDHQLVHKLHRFSSGWYEVEKIIDNSGKFLVLDGNILMSIGSAETIVGSHLLF